MDPKGPRLIARRRHHAARPAMADRHGPAAQGGIVALFDRRIKGVHVDMNDFFDPRWAGPGFFVSVAGGHAIAPWLVTQRTMSLASVAPDCRATSLPLGNDHQGRNAADVETAGDAREHVGVHLEEARRHLHFLGGGGEMRTHDLAGAAPFGPEIDDDREVGALDMAIEFGLVMDFDDAGKEGRAAGAAIGPQAAVELFAAGAIDFAAMRANHMNLVHPCPPSPVAGTRKIRLRSRYIFAAAICSRDRRRRRSGRTIVWRVLGQALPDFAAGAGAFLGAGRGLGPEPGDLRECEAGIFRRPGGARTRKGASSGLEVDNFAHGLHPLRFAHSPFVAEQVPRQNGQSAGAGREGRANPASTLGKEMTQNHFLLRHDDEGVVTLTLNRPDSRNGLSLGMLGALRAALAEIEADASARVVILAGAGPAFCAGHDLKEMRARDYDPAYVEGALRALRRGHAGDRGFAQAGDRPRPRRRHGGGGATRRQRRSCARRRGRPLRHAGRPYRAVLLDADGRLVAQYRAQARHADAADRRSDRRGNRFALRPRQRSRSRRRTGGARSRPGQKNRVEIAPDPGDRQEGFLSSGRDCRWPKPMLTPATQWRKICKARDAREGIGAFLDKRPPRWTGE